MSQEDLLFLQILERKTVRLEGGRLEMPLPFKNDRHPSMPDNRKAALSRLSQLKRKLSRDPSCQQQYASSMRELLERGHAELAPIKSGAANYIPHHAVHQLHKQKMRVVFDCSAQFRGVSLNNFHAEGPRLHEPTSGCPDAVPEVPGRLLLRR